MALNKCPVCGSVKRKVIYKELTDRTYFCAPGVWTMFSCKTCGVAYIDPIPTKDSIKIAYGSYYTHETGERPLFENLRGINRAQRIVANSYRNWRFGFNEQPANYLGVLITMLLPAYRELLDAEMRYLPLNTPGARVLDVGCGNGKFLRLARAIGWEVAGADPDPKAVEICRIAGLEVREGGVEAFLHKPKYFDVVTLSHVIEHVYEPKLFLRQCLKLLKPGGQIFIDTPNLKSLGHRRYGRNWRGLEPPRHLVLFDWDSLESLMSELGIRDIRRFPRSAVYSSMNAQSLRIEEGRDPYVASEPKQRDILAGLYAILRVYLNYRQSEFVTLVAWKPENWNKIDLTT